MDGIKETEKETKNECEQKILTILEEKLGVKDVIIERAHRMRQKKRRPVKNNDFQNTKLQRQRMNTGANKETAIDGNLY